MLPSEKLSVEFSVKPLSFHEAEDLVKEKFLIQALQINEKKTLLEIEQLWEDIKKAPNNHNIFNYKLKCEIFIIENGRRVFMSNPQKKSNMQNSLY